MGPGYCSSRYAKAGCDLMNKVLSNQRGRCSNNSAQGGGGLNNIGTVGGRDTRLADGDTENILEN